MNDARFKRLIDKYLQGKCSVEEIAMLHEFYESFQKDSGEEIPDTFEMWLRKERIYQSIKQNIKEEEREAYDRLRKSRRFLPKTWMRFAASFTLIVIISLASYQAYQSLPSEEIVYLERATHKGQTATITLMDGTKVHLNADSKITFPESFGTQSRDIRLEGEAFFEVVRDVHRPFTISSGKLTTTVLGTSFNIKSFEGEPMHVTVASGKVQVEEGQQTVLLLPNQQAYYDTHLQLREVDSQLYTSWINKTLRFEDHTLQEAAQVLERWYDVEIEFKDEQLKDITFSAKYIDERLINILESLKHILSIEYEIKDEKLILIKQNTNL